MAYLNKIDINGRTYYLQHLTDGKYEAKLPTLAKDDELLLRSQVVNSVTSSASQSGSSIPLSAYQGYLLNSKLNKEILDREADVDGEKTRAESAELVLTNNLNQEIQDRADDVDAEEMRALAAEKVLTDNLAQEVTERVNAVATEQNRATAKENEINANLTTEIDRAKAAEKANADAIAVLNGSSDGSVAKAVADAKTELEDEISKKLDKTDKYVHPSHDAVTSGLYNITVDEFGHVSSVVAVSKSDIARLGIPEQDTTYDIATTDTDGLLSATDKTLYDSYNSMISAIQSSSEDAQSKANSAYDSVLSLQSQINEVRAIPVNLLDNSNFKNPINQRGKTSYDAGDYTIDRWYAEANGATDVLQLNSGYITMSTDTTKTKLITQRYEDNTLEPGEIYTAAVWLLDGSVLVGNAIIPQDGTDKDVTIGTKLQARFKHNSLGFILWNSADIDVTYNIIHVGLFKGAYTVLTIPDYQPKEYSVELAECQRYYQKVSFDNSYALGHCAIGSGAINVPLTMKFPMRIANPTISGKIDALTAENWQGAQDPTLSSSISGFVASVSIKAGFTFEAGKSYLVKGSIELSADL